MAYGWPQVWTKVGDKMKDFNGKAGIRHSWLHWQHQCYAFDFEAGQVFSVFDGVEDGMDIGGDDYFKNPLEKVNNEIKTKSFVTDVLIGCDPWTKSFGKIVDIQVFDRLLSFDEMRGMTICGGKKLEGNIVNSNKDPYSLYGTKANDIIVHPEEICPTKNFREGHNNGICFFF